jgi:hypothetical protein
VRAWLVFGAFLLCATASGEQTALSHSEVILVKTCLGTAAPASSPVEPSTNIAIAVFADTLREEELAQVRQEISSFYQASRLTSLRVAAIYGSEIQFAGQFRTRALLQAGLAELLKAPPGASGVVPLRFYTYLGNVASQFGSGWYEPGGGGSVSRDRWGVDRFHGSMARHSIPRRQTEGQLLDALGRRL